MKYVSDYNRSAFSETCLESLGNLAHTSLVCANPLHITTYAEIQCTMKVV